MVRNVIFVFVFALLLVTTLVFARTFIFGIRQLSVEKVTEISLDQHAKAKRLGEALSFKTVSMAGGPRATEEFLKFHEFLETTYPRTHGELTREVVNDYSLLYDPPP